MNFKEAAFSMKDKLVDFRRDFHMHPEASFCGTFVCNNTEDKSIEIKKKIK